MTEEITHSKNTSCISQFLGEDVCERRRVIQKGDVQFTAFIGAGTYGEVFQAVWRNRMAAVKSIHNTALFREEAALLSVLSHRNIIRYFGEIPPSDSVETVDGTQLQMQRCNLLVTEYMPGGTLHQRIYSEEPYKLHDMISWMLDIVSALAYLHFDGPACILHLDLKPLNVLLTRGGICKLADLGAAMPAISRSNDCIEQKNSADCMQKRVCGTPRYMAPEVIRGCHLLTDRADIWSFGVLCSEMIGREQPFPEHTNNFTISFLVGSRNKHPNMPESVPGTLRSLLELAWQPDPQHRPSAHHIRHELETYLCKITACQEEDVTISTFSSRKPSSTESEGNESRSSSSSLSGRESKDVVESRRPLTESAAHRDESASKLLEVNKNWGEKLQCEESFSLKSDCGSHRDCIIDSSLFLNQTNEVRPYDSHDESRNYRKSGLGFLQNLPLYEDDTEFLETDDDTETSLSNLALNDRHSKSAFTKSNKERITATRCPSQRGRTEKAVLKIFHHDGTPYRKAHSEFEDIQANDVHDDVFSQNKNNYTICCQTEGRGHQGKYHGDYLLDQQGQLNPQISDVPARQRAYSDSKSNEEMQQAKRAAFARECRFSVSLLEKNSTFDRYGHESTHPLPHPYEEFGSPVFGCGTSSPLSMWSNHLPFLSMASPSRSPSPCILQQQRQHQLQQLVLPSSQQLHELKSNQCDQNNHSDACQIEEQQASVQAQMARLRLWEERLAQREQELTVREAALLSKEERGLRPKRLSRVFSSGDLSLSSSASSASVFNSHRDMHA
eukprot:gene1066-4297_t